MRLIFSLGLLAIVTGFALWKGKAPERLTALILLAGIAFSMSFRVPYETSFGRINLEIWLTDLLVFIGLTYIALHAERFWTIWISSFQLVQLISHLPELLVPHLLPTVHTTIISLWVYPMLGILFAGTWRHVQRVRVSGSEPSWSRS
jgi:hypothetical protein